MQILFNQRNLRLILLVTMLLLSPVTRGNELQHYLKNISADSVGQVLLVNKAAQTLLVMNSNAPGSVQVLDTFRITTGRVDGNKEEEGDLKTPEGIYEIVELIPGNQLPPKYGPMAFVLDYPNFVDRIQNRNGSNIWIHGRDEEIIDRQTEGCISLENGRLWDLNNYIRLNNTPVIIIDSLVHIGHHNETIKFTLTDSLFNRWRQSWESGDMTIFAKLLSPDFNTRSYPNRNSYIRNKQTLEKLYSWKKLTVDRVRIIQSDYEARICFEQQYLCPRFYSRGNKQLSLIWADSLWQIVTEDFAITEPRRYVSTALNTFINKWEAAWESADIDRYASCYDAHFSNPNFASPAAWVAYKQNIFATSRNIQITISDLSVTSTIPFQWIISFQQDYRTDTYRDVGNKKLTVIGHPARPENFKILSEEWKAIH